MKDEKPFGHIDSAISVELEEEDIRVTAEWPLECALRLENQLSLTFKHGKPYNDKSRSLLFNLGDEKNPNARLALLTKKVTPEAFL